MASSLAFRQFRKPYTPKCTTKLREVDAADSTESP